MMNDPRHPNDNTRTTQASGTSTTHRRAPNRVATAIVAALVGVCSFLGLVAPAHAVGGTGLVLQLQIAPNGTYATVVFSNPSGAKPSCQTANVGLGEFSFDYNTAKGKAMLTLFQSAMLAGKSVGYGGAETCYTVESNRSVQQVGIVTLIN